LNVQAIDKVFRQTCFWGEWGRDGCVGFFFSTGR